MEILISFSFVVLVFAITIIGGMITGIIFSLNIIPMLYASFAGRFERKRILKN